MLQAHGSNLPWIPPAQERPWQTVLTSTVPATVRRLIRTSRGRYLACPSETMPCRSPTGRSCLLYRSFVLHSCLTVSMTIHWIARLGSMRSGATSSSDMHAGKNSSRSAAARPIWFMRSMKRRYLWRRIGTATCFSSGDRDRGTSRRCEGSRRPAESGGEAEVRGASRCVRDR
jgi:hypothetical protein